MKTYSHDYTKAAEVENYLYSATRLMANDCYDAALERINEARQLLQEYLAKDNMVEDNDVAFGWVKSQDAFDDDEMDFIRDIFGETLGKCPTACYANEALGIINKCQRYFDCDEFEDVEQFCSNTSNTWNEIKTEE